MTFGIPVAVSQSSQPQNNAPTAISQGAQVTTVNGVPVQGLLGGPFIYLFSRDPAIVVQAVLRGVVTSPLPRPKVDTIDRYGQVGITEWTGREPFEMTVPIRFGDVSTDGSIEPQIQRLEALALRHAGHDEPPVVEVVGPVPLPRPKIQWRVAALEESADRPTTYNLQGERTSISIDVRLVERSTADLLTETLRSGKQAQGTAKRRTRVRQGEDSLYDVSRRVYGDPSRASDIARANSVKGKPLRLGARLRPGLGLNLP